MTDLDALERLLAEATPGPWERERVDDDAGEINAKIYGPDGGDVCALFEDARPEERSPVGPDARLICLLRNTAPALIQEVRRLRESLREAEGTLRQERESAKVINTAALEALKANDEARSALAAERARGERLAEALQEAERKLGQELALTATQRRAGNRCEMCGSKYHRTSQHEPAVQAFLSAVARARSALADTGKGEG